MMPATVETGAATSHRPSARWVELHDRPSTGLPAASGQRRCPFVVALERVGLMVDVAGSFPGIVLSMQSPTHRLIADIDSIPPLDMRAEQGHGPCRCPISKILGGTT